MTTTTETLGLTAGEAGRDAGMAQAEHAADPRVILLIDKAIAEANASGKRWSANTIRDQFAVTSQGLVGARVRAATQRRPREMKHVDWIPSNLKSTRHHEIKVWVGIVRAPASTPAQEKTP